MQFIEHSDFMSSVRDLYQKGGRFQKAAERVFAARGRVSNNCAIDLVFQGLGLTNHGESRIPNCFKFDLTGFARLVTARANGICVFLFAGDHDSVDRWLDKNRGFDFVGRRTEGGVTLEPVRMSGFGSGCDGVIEAPSDLSVGALIEKLPARNRNSLLQGLDASIVESIRQVESITEDDVILERASRCGNGEQQTAVLDVLVLLKGGELARAKNRVDLYTSEAKRLQDLTSEEVASIRSGESTVLVRDVDPELFEHFVKTASFNQWMLYLHPDQRQFVDADYPGPARLAGISGSGKTCVVIHRAIRLAERYDEPVLILTLSSALARLIDDLISAARGVLRPLNIRVSSVWELCREKLLALEPSKADYYTRTTIARNPYAVAEHIDEIWTEFYRCEANNRDAMRMFGVHQTLLVRGVYPEDYLRQELDYVRSAFAPSERAEYLGVARSGRIVPFDDNMRQQILDGLEGWEAKMGAVGAIDDVGIVTALYPHLGDIKAEYRCVLVDEIQDMGTLELAIIRRLAKAGENDLFLSGDAAQSVYTKHADYKAAGIDLQRRTVTLKRNYRNSRQILEAAHQVLSKAFGKIPSGMVDLELLEPEYANFHSPKPLMLKADDFRTELGLAVEFAQNALKDGTSGHKCCIALCGFSQRSVEVLGERLSFPVLSGETEIAGGKLFLSDLEQTKGFEFDTMLVVNCSALVIPHPDLPQEESYRELCKLYVAMTRAKTQLVVSYSGDVSRFVDAAREAFIEAQFESYVDSETKLTIELPPQFIGASIDKRDWEVPGEEFLRLRDAVGLSRVLQDEVSDHVTGMSRTRDGRIIEWKTFATFVEAMESARARNQIISDEAWTQLQEHIANRAGLAEE